MYNGWKNKSKINFQTPILKSVILYTNKLIREKILEVNL